MTDKVVLTIAQAEQAMLRLMMDLPNEGKESLLAAHEAMKACPMVDPADVFCDGIAEMQIAPRRLRVELAHKLRNDVQSAAAYTGPVHCY